MLPELASALKLVMAAEPKYFLYEQVKVSKPVEILYSKRDYHGYVMSKKVTCTKCGQFIPVWLYRHGKFRVISTAQHVIDPKEKALPKYKFF